MILKQQSQKKQNPYLIMMGLYLGGFAGMFSETALNIALPELSEVFHVKPGLAQWLVIGYMLMIGLILPFVSLLAKWIPLRKLSGFALCAFMGGALISGFAVHFPMLLFGRMIQGIGTGIVLPLMFSMIMEVFPPHRIGRAMGMNALVIMFAPAIGPTLAGILIGAFSWRWLFFLFALIAFAALVFTVAYMTEPYEQTRPHIDIRSCLLSCAGFGGLVLGAGLAGLYGLSSGFVLSCLIVGAAGIVIYVRRQLHMEQPVLNLRVFCISRFAVSALLVMIDFGITLSSMFILPQYLQKGLMLPVAMTGVVMLPGGVVNAAVSLFSGVLYDRMGAKKPVTAGFLLSLIGAALLLVSGPAQGVGFVILCHLILMIGVPLAMSPAQSNGLQSLPSGQTTDGSTILNTMQQVWGAVCTAVATILMGVGEKFGSGGEAYVSGARFGFGFTLVLAAAGLLISFRIRKEK